MKKPATGIISFLNLLWNYLTKKLQCFIKENVYNYVFLNTQRHRKIEGRGSVKAVEFISECPHSYSLKCLVLYEKGPSEILV